MQALNTLTLHSPRSCLLSCLLLNDKKQPKLAKTHEIYTSKNAKETPQPFYVEKKVSEATKK